MSWQEILRKSNGLRGSYLCPGVGCGLFRRWVFETCMLAFRYADACLFITPVDVVDNRLFECMHLLFGKYVVHFSCMW